MRRDEVAALAERLTGLLAELETHAPPDVVETVVEIVDGIQRVHAEGLRRLAELLSEDRDRFGRALDDPLIANLFALYDLEIVEGRGQAATSQEAVQPPAREGGEESRLGGPTRSPTGDVSVVPRNKLVQLERKLDDGSTRPVGPGDEPRRLELGARDEIPEGRLHGVVIENLPLLVVALEDGLRAYRNACPGSILPLHLGRLEEGTIVCPWHGCRFDIRTGERERGDGPPLQRLEVALEDERVVVEA